MKITILKGKKIYIYPLRYAVAFILLITIFLSLLIFSPILLSDSDLKRNPEIPYLFLCFFL